MGRWLNLHIWWKWSSTFHHLLSFFFFFNFQMLHWLESFCFNWWIIYYLAAQCTLFPKVIMIYHWFAFHWVSWWFWSCHIDREVQTGDQATRKLFKFYDCNLCFLKEKTKKILLICILVIESVPCIITLLSEKLF